jgi:hypothetical protein
VERLASAGVEGELLPFPFGRIDPSETSVAAGTFRVPGVFLPDSGLPAPDTVIRGVFSLGSIALVRTEAHGMPSEVEQVRLSGHEAIVVAVAGEPGGATLLNAWRYDDPGDIPIVQVPGEAWSELEAARDAGIPVEVRCGGTRTETSAFNVLATVPGKRSEQSPIVVLTPRSGWWHCAGERGGGLAIWLEVARAARALSLNRDLVLLATTGHELGFLGAKRFFNTDPDLAQHALAWIHLGANIGAKGSRLVVRASDTSLLEVAQQVPELPRLSPAFEVNERPAGEAREVFIRGGRFISLVAGGFPLFHSTLDRWPEAIDAQAIATAGTVVLQIINALDRQP